MLHEGQQDRNEREFCKERPSLVCRTLADDALTERNYGMKHGVSFANWMSGWIQND